MASGLLVQASSVGASGLCGSPICSRRIEQASWYGQSGIFGEKAFAKFDRLNSSDSGYGVHTSPGLLCVAVVWWSDAAKKLKPEWEKAHLMRVEKLKGGSVSKDAWKDATLEDAEEDYLLRWTESLKSRSKDFVSAGLTPEMIIGRTAMLGFFLASTVEVETGKSVLQQLTIRGEVASVLVVITVAALSLLLHKRYTKEDGSSAIFNPFGLFTPSAELLNGQAAMLGFILLIATEAAKGSALF
ncbi:hypothetical protein R1sor_009662 [Riccia sorocarpa]|uniref:Early light-induced protein n=1 Tax=Riccia sorocarpa TaxID=122646 RepID=A0ABD3HXK2_9MARC